MRVEVAAIDEFLEHLRAVGPGRVFGGTVYCSTFHRPIDGDKRSALKFSVVIQASAVVDVPSKDGREAGQFVLDGAEDCGRDYCDQSGEKAGSERAAELRAKLYHWCVENKIELMPGVVSE